MAKPDLYALGLKPSYTFETLVISTESNGSSHRIETKQ